MKSRCYRRAAHWMQGAALGLLAVAATAPALAQQNNTVETVTVTAERRTIDAQKAPIAVTVFNQEDLNKRAINTVDSLQFTTPSLTILDSGVNAVINIRGIGKSDAGAQDSSGVLIYRDGVSTTPNGLIADEPYYDISSVEVLRGPQGTFAGQNATGGAIFIKEADPTLDGINGWAEGQYGNYNDIRFRGAINLPLTDDLAIRIATDDENRNTFFHMSGPFTGNPGNLHESNWRLGTLWKPNERFQAVLKFDFNYIDHGGSPASPFTGSTKNIFDVASDSHLSGIEQQYRGTLNMSYEFEDGITLKSISGYQLGRLAYALDADGTANTFPLGDSPEIFVARATDQTLSEEINLVSPDTGPLTWIVGGVYQNDLLNTPQFLLSLTPFGTLTTGAALNALQDRASRDSWGIFGQTSYNITHDLKVNFGLRYSETTFTLHDIAELVEGPPLLPFNASVIEDDIQGKQEKDTRLTGKLDLDYTLDEQNFLYAFVATGHKGGGINADGTVFGAENVTDYEVGWKGTYFDDHLHTQLGGFYNSYKDFQLAIYDQTVGAGEDVNANGTSTIKGIEAQAQGVFGGFSFDLGTSYLQSEIGQFYAVDSRTGFHGPCNAQTGPANPATGCQDLTGRELPLAPHWTAQVGVQYAFDMGDDQTLTPRIDYGLVGAKWGSVFEDPLENDHLNAQNIFNAQLIYDRPDNWEVTAYMTNVFDLHYVATELLGTLGFAGPPRQFGIRVSKAF